MIWTEYGQLKCYKHTKDTTLEMDNVDPEVKRPGTKHNDAICGLNGHKRMRHCHIKSCCYYSSIQGYQGRIQLSKANINLSFSGKK